MINPSYCSYVHQLNAIKLGHHLAPSCKFSHHEFLTQHGGPTTDTTDTSPEGCTVVGSARNVAPAWGKRGDQQSISMNIPMTDPYVWYRLMDPHLPYQYTPVMLAYIAYIRIRHGIG